jgi:hypothetical protein
MHKSHAVIIIMLLIIIALIVIYGGRVVYSPECKKSSAASVPCATPVPCTAAEAALMASANAIYNDANAIVGTLSSWLPQVYYKYGVTPNEVAADRAFQSIMAFMNSNAQIGIQDSPKAAAQSLATAVPLLKSILVELLNPSPKAHAAFYGDDKLIDAARYYLLLDAITDNLSATQSAINAYVANK